MIFVASACVQYQVQVKVSQHTGYRHVAPEYPCMRDFGDQCHECKTQSTPVADTVFLPCWCQYLQREEFQVRLCHGLGPQRSTAIHQSALPDAIRQSTALVLQGGVGGSGALAMHHKRQSCTSRLIYYPTTALQCCLRHGERGAVRLV
jgi:hypothetical protein